jgi:hypothetical protein
VKQQKIKLLVIGLAALLVFTSMVALLMYTKQRDMRAVLEDRVGVFVAARELSAGERIGTDAVRLVKLPREYVGFKPPALADIVGRYAGDGILQNEPFRRAKLRERPLRPHMAAPVKTAAHKPPAASADAPVATLDLLSIPLNLFKNVDQNLKIGDRIDIVSVATKLPQGKNSVETFTPKYIALGVTVTGLAYRGTPQKQMVRRLAEGKETRTVTADAMTIDMGPKQITNFLAFYYKTQQLNKLRPYNNDNQGHLWMVKCGTRHDSTLQSVKERLLANAEPRKRKAPSRPIRPRIEIRYEQ